MSLFRICSKVLSISCVLKIIIGNGLDSRIVIKDFGKRISVGTVDSGGASWIHRIFESNIVSLMILNPNFSTQKFNDSCWLFTKIIIEEILAIMSMTQFYSI
jgi:hypothetical protein